MKIQYTSEGGKVVRIERDDGSWYLCLESDLSPEELAAALPAAPPTVQEQIEAIEAQFTTTLQMRVSLQEPAAVTQVQGMYAQIAALKAQL